MFNFIEKIIDKLSFKFNFLNRTNSPSSKQKQINTDGDNIGRDKIIYNNESKLQTASVIYCWGTNEQQQENHEILKYEFDLMLQNKSDELLKNMWVNFSSSGFNLVLESTKHTNLFEGWNISNQALNLVTKDDCKFTPQSFLAPFKIRIILKKESLPDKAWLYFSYGSPDVKKVERKVEIDEPALREFITRENHNTEAFLELLGLNK